MFNESIDSIVVI